MKIDLGGGGVRRASVIVGASDFILECQDSTPAGFRFPKVLGPRTYSKHLNSWNSRIPFYVVSWYLHYFMGNGQILLVPAVLNFMPSTSLVSRNTGNEGDQVSL